MDKILVIVVTFNAIKWIDRCLTSLQLSSLRPNIFVVDNGSTDGTQAYIQNHYPEAIFYQSEKNLGFGRANNIGLRYALEKEYDYVYLLNQDAWVDPNTFETLINIHKKHRGYGIISPLQCQANEKMIDIHFGKRVIDFGKNIEILNDLLLAEVKDIYDVDFVMAAHWLISRDCVMSVGGFSPTFAHYGEDGNYIQRAIFNGFKVGFSPKTNAIHDRENRQIDIRKRLKISKMGYFAIFSNPNMSFIQSSKTFILQLLRNIIKYPSFRHANVVFSVLLNMRVIRRNRQKSINLKTPFL